jgi:acetyltransferase-like isoleucine patch superfamily enzyme
VSIGRHVVIGSGSIVTSDIPDYSVAIGTPAKVVKKYDFEKHLWQRM